MAFMSSNLRKIGVRSDLFNGPLGTLQEAEVCCIHGRAWTDSFVASSVSTER